MYRCFGKEKISYLYWNSKTILYLSCNEIRNFMEINPGEAGNHSEIYCLLWNQTFHSQFQKHFSCRFYPKLAQFSPKTHPDTVGSILLLFPTYNTPPSLAVLTFTISCNTFGLDYQNNMNWAKILISVAAYKTLVASEYFHFCLYI